MKKYINIALGVLIVIALIVAFTDFGESIPGLLNIIVILATLSLIVNAYFDLKEGKDKGLPIFIMIVAVLANIVNIVVYVLDVMGIM